MKEVSLLLIVMLGSASGFSSALVSKDQSKKVITIKSHLYIYGDFATKQVAANVAKEISQVWNANTYKAKIENVEYTIKFQISSELMSFSRVEQIAADAIKPEANFIRILEKPNATITSSFIVGNTNSGIFLLSHNLGSSTTAAHEYGHSIGLNHPEEKPIIGQPGIMVTNFYEVESEFWLSPQADVSSDLAKLDLTKRKVLDQDMADLKLEKLTFINNVAQLGKSRTVFLFDAEGNIL